MNEYTAILLFLIGTWLAGLITIGVVLGPEYAVGWLIGGIIGYVIPEVSCR